MKIQMLGSPVASYDLDEEAKVLTVAGLAMNLEELEKDTQNIITISQEEKGPVLGPVGRYGFIADIEIPPRRYEYLSGTDENGDPVTYQVAVPLDTERITLRLWPLVATPTNEIN